MLWKSLFTGAIVGCLGTFYAGSSLWNMFSGNIYYSDTKNEIKQPESSVVIVVDSGVGVSTTPDSDKAQGPSATGGVPSGTGQNPQQRQSQPLPAAEPGRTKGDKISPGPNAKPEVGKRDRKKSKKEQSERGSDSSSRSSQGKQRQSGGGNGRRGKGSSG